MINLHAATSLAEDLGLDLVDIYGIRKWIQMQASPFNDPDIVREMVRNLPIKEFGKHLKINRLWYNGCKAELWKRYKEAEEVRRNGGSRKSSSQMWLYNARVRLGEMDSNNVQHPIA
ncbi:hypothetical protein GLOIN_2v1779779 [Rhizophagus irregularis DAOM 181602=DAOM 197198]|nr:hypothetical protein GLOIN_2v1779779 [Rhizophagus irregularis DAOM 181602=DAOM 197198]